MRILLTGGTGFLGKRVLERLVEDERVSDVLVITRRKRHHESPKVKVLVLDLSEAQDLRENVQLAGIDHVLHLAGLYDFSAGHARCYEQNVLATLRLTWLLKDQGIRAPIHFASTYAVGCPQETLLREAPLERLPPLEFPYAYSKALAENVLLESGFPLRVFRLGILIGDSRTGAIEKEDGVYPFIRLLERLSRNLPRKLGTAPLILPIPADPSTLLPLVPVDVAAGALVASIFEPFRHAPEFFGLYNPDSASVREVVESARARLLPGARVLFVKSRLPRALLAAQSSLTGVSATTFRYANHPTKLDSSLFRERFPRHAVPGFDELKGRLLSQEALR